MHIFHSAKPYINEWTTVMSIDIDSNEIIPCSANGNPVPRVTWYRISDEKPEVIGSRDKQLSLNLTRVRRSEEGMYRCIAKNTYGTITKDLNVTVIGEEAWEGGL